MSPTDGVIISAQTQAGLFYGVQSLLQLLPPTPPDTLGCDDSGISVPAVHVRDGANDASTHLPTVTSNVLSDQLVAPVLLLGGSCGWPTTLASC